MLQVYMQPATQFHSIFHSTISITHVLLISTLLRHSAFTFLASGQIYNCVEYVWNNGWIVILFAFCIKICDNYLNLNNYTDYIVVLVYLSVSLFAIF